MREIRKEEGERERERDGQSATEGDSEVNIIMVERGSQGAKEK